MSIKSWNIVLVFALLIVLAGGGFILYQNHQQKQAEIAKAQAEEEARLAEEARRKAEEQAALMQSFEDFLNGFLNDIDNQVREYKQARAVMAELRKPENLTSPEYITENARLAESTLMSLQLQMDDIMTRFDTADENLQPLVEQLTEDGQAHVQETWDTVRDANAQRFTAFFTSDQDLLAAQLELIEFYRDHAEQLQIDLENSRVLFDDVALQEEEALLRAAIMEIKAIQKDLLPPAEDQNKTNKQSPQNISNQSTTSDQ